LIKSDVSGSFGRDIKQSWRKTMKRIIPGHAHAFTLPLLAVMALVLFFIVEDKMRVVFALIAFATVFFGDQATHLGQEEHSGQAPTWIEHQLQKYSWFSRLLSAFLTIFFMAQALL